MTEGDRAGSYAREVQRRLIPPAAQHVIGVPRLAAIWCRLDPERVRAFGYVGGRWTVDLLAATAQETDLYRAAFRNAACALGYNVDDLVVRTVTGDA